MRFMTRPLLALLTATSLAVPASAAEFSTTNFVVTAKTVDVARQVAQQAEVFRRSKAIDWLGRELPPWRQPCAVTVRITTGGAGGATSFAFDNGVILSQRMTVEGPLERVLNSVLPHEVTHTIFAAKFRRPLPRWADEGGAVLSEDYQEIARHDLLVRSLINGGRMIPLNRLFVMTEYPKDVMALYAEGFSVANFLVSKRGKPAFLEFVWEGQSTAWAPAVQKYYGYRSVADLEKAWIDWLIEGKGTGADGPGPNFPSAFAESGSRPPTMERIARGQAPDEPERSELPRPVIAGGNRQAARPRDPIREDQEVAFATAERTGTSGEENWQPAITGAGYSRANEADREASPRESAGNPGNRPTRRIPIAVGRTRRSVTTGDNP